MEKQNKRGTSAQIEIDITYKLGWKTFENTFLFNGLVNKWEGMHLEGVTTPVTPSPS